MEEFHLKRITQSDYRGSSGRDKRSSNPVALSLDIEALSIKDDGIKRRLIMLIKKESKVVVEALLPEPVREQFYKSLWLKQILKGLKLKP